MVGFNLDDSPHLSNWKGATRRMPGKLISPESDVTGFPPRRIRVFSEHAPSSGRALEFRKASRIGSERVGDVLLTPFLRAA